MTTRRVLASGGFTAVVAFGVGLMLRGAGMDTSIERVFLTAASSCMAGMAGALFMLWCQEYD